MVTRAGRVSGAWKLCAPRAGVEKRRLDHEFIKADKRRRAIMAMANIEANRRARAKKGRAKRDARKATLLRLLDVVSCGAHRPKHETFTCRRIAVYVPTPAFCLATVVGLQVVQSGSPIRANTHTSWLEMGPVVTTLYHPYFRISLRNVEAPGSREAASHFQSPRCCA